MKLTRKNVLQLVSETFGVNTDFIGISRETCRDGKHFEMNVTSKRYGINSSVYSHQDDWEKMMIDHIKWQTDLKVLK